MGMYDSIYLKFKCPYCKKISKIEFQTKDGECFMGRYKKGDKFEGGRFRKINAYGSCYSLICQFESAKESVWTCGYYGGFSRSFDSIIYCDSNGRITNKVKVMKLTSHKGIMKGKLGELKGEEDNMKIVRYVSWTKGGKMIDAKMKPMITNGWLDKFRKDSFDDGKNKYEKILYLYNLEDSEEAMRLWFCFRYGLDEIIKYLMVKLRLKEDEELASVFLSNEPDDLFECVKEVKRE